MCEEPTLRSTETRLQGCEKKTNKKKGGRERIRALLCVPNNASGRGRSREGFRLGRK
jgi:hypothetical protein